MARDIGDPVIGFMIQTGCIGSVDTTSQFISEVDSARARSNFVDSSEREGVDYSTFSGTRKII